MQWDQILLFTFIQKKSDPIDILLFEWRLTALEYKCIKYVFVGSGLVFCFYSYKCNLY